MEEKGWISLHRKFQDHWLWQEKRVYSRSEAWVDILLTVNHSEQKLVIKNIHYIIKRGDSLLSLESWSKRWTWNKSKVRRFLNLLQKDNMILLKNETQTTRLTVCNYDNYQTPRNASETQMKRKRNADETHLTPNNKDNNINKDNNTFSKPKKTNIFSEEVLNCYSEVLKYFPDHLHPKKEELKISWMDTLDKLNRIDKIPFEIIIEITKKTRSDDFWSGNFLSIPKLRKKNNDKIKYIVFFNEKFNRKKPLTINRQTKEVLKSNADWN